MIFTKKDKIRLAISSILIVILFEVIQIFLQEHVLSIMLGVLAFLILFTTVAIWRKLQLVDQDIKTIHKNAKDDFKQTEALLSLVSVLNLKSPLPATRGWAASPDLLKKILEIIFQEKPRLIVEASSGVSTLVAAYCLQQNGIGKIISLEHDSNYAALSQKVITLHNLQEVATVIHAPLKEFELQEEKWLWYDIDRLKIDAPIDLLLIDGPPLITQKFARYPALPLLVQQLSPQAIIVLDDGDRDDEKEIVTRWLKGFSDFTYEFLKLEKGAFVLYRSKQAND